MSEPAQVSYLLRGEIDLPGVEVDREVPLRVAAVHDGEILASETVDVQKSRAGRIAYELRFVLPEPCGFRVILGRAGVPDRVFLAAEVAQRWVSPRGPEGEQVAGAAAHPITVQVAPLVVEAIEAARYLPWPGLCRRYRVHGRVVCRHWRFDGHILRFCDDPVPGAPRTPIGTWAATG